MFRVIFFKTVLQVLPEDMSFFSLQTVAVYHLLCVSVSLMDMLSFLKYSKYGLELSVFQSKSSMSFDVVPVSEEQSSNLYFILSTQHLLTQMWDKSFISNCRSLKYVFHLFHLQYLLSPLSHLKLDLFF